MAKYTATITIDVDEQPNDNAVSTLEALALAIHSAASRIDTGASFDAETGYSPVYYRGRRVGTFIVTEKSI